MKISEKKKNLKLSVLYYKPNLLGYIRILCILLSFFLFKNYLYLSLFLYAFSVFLDFVDGPIARKYNQCSRFGKYLDVLTDKMGTLALTFMIAQYNYNFIIEFMLLYHLNEIMGLWMYLAHAARYGEHHKKINNDYEIINWFYQNKYYFLDILIICTELFHVLTALYIRLENPSLYIVVGMILCLPGFLTKGFVALIRFIDCIKKLAALDMSESNQLISFYQKFQILNFMQILFMI